MKNNTTTSGYAKAMEQDLVDYLDSQGFHPAKIRKDDYWYLSPLRDEKTPSFKINRKLNLWYDFGIGKGGNLVDLAVLFKGCTIKEFVQSFDGNFSFSNRAYSASCTCQLTQDNSLKIISVKPLQSLALLSYFQQRNIPLTISEKYCVEIGYNIHGKFYYSIGFKNDSGGYELRNIYCKNCSHPKGITTFKNGANKLAVFEGFFDFLSFLYLLPDLQFFDWDFCILNSLSFIEKITSFLPSYKSIHLFFDNDKAGQKCSAALLKTDSRFIDESSLYKNYKDLNDWIMHIGKIPQSQHPQIPP